MISVASQIHDAIVLASIPIDGVSYSLATGVRIDFKEEATVEQRTAAQGIVDTWDFGEVATAAKEVLSLKTRAKALLDNNASDIERVIVAIASLVRKQLNVLRKRDRDRNAALQNAATLAAVKTAWGVANLPSLDDFSLDDVINALKTEIG